MALNQPDIRELKSLLDWVNLTPDVRELSIKYGDVELFVSRNERALTSSATEMPPAAAPPAQHSAPAAAPPNTAPSNTAAPEAAANEAPPASDAAPAEENSTTITAPMVGTFYSAPNPGAPDFVTVGDRVSADSVLGIVEVMKLMNNVEAKVGGIVTQILVENNQAVEFGQPMMVIERDA